MNLTDYTSLLNNPKIINNEKTISLEKIIEEFPYFQSARALRLKGLYDQDSFLYNHALKVTAAHTTDRTVLFDFITSEHFIPAQKESEKLSVIFEEAKNSEINISTENEKTGLSISTSEESIKNIIEKSTVIAEKEANNPIELIEERLSIGKPLDFSRDEKYSFQEWLQLAHFKTIKREDDVIEENTTENSTTNEKFPDALDIERQKKSDLIDRFIETNPKIIASKTNSINITVPEKNIQDNAYLMTETLAKVYLEQKKYQKAIQAYEILILKYPEKSTFFADRIDDIKALQQNNN